GHYFYPVEKELAEGLVTEPLVHRIRTQIKKRGFGNVAGKVTITFSGYADDEREIFAIPEVRAYWRKLDRELPELPALLAYVPLLGHNGPAHHLMLLGTIDAATHRPEIAGYDVHVADAEPIVRDAIARIHRAGSRYHLSPEGADALIRRFVNGATHHL